LNIIRNYPMFIMQNLRGSSKIGDQQHQNDNMSKF
jgi:hypothetical protein